MCYFLREAERVDRTTREFCHTALSNKNGEFYTIMIYIRTWTGRYVFNGVAYLRVTFYLNESSLVFWGRDAQFVREF